MSNENFIEKFISLAQRLAISQRRKFVTVEHFLVVLLDDSAAKSQLSFWSVNQLALGVSLDGFLRANVPPAVVAGSHPEPTAGFQRVIRRALASSKGKAATGVDFLNAILHERDGVAVQFLRKHGLAISLPTYDLDVDVVVDAQPANVVEADNPELRAAIHLIANIAKVINAVKDDTSRLEQQAQLKNVFSCLVVNRIEASLDQFIDHLVRVNDDDRAALARNLSTLVLAPDSQKLKEKVLKGLAGSSEFGFVPSEKRNQARAFIELIQGM